MKKMIAAVLMLAFAVPVWAGQWADLSGSWSDIHQFRKVVVRDDASWKALWKEHRGDQTPAPAVDFNTQAVVGVFLGERSGTGHGVSLLAVTAPAKVTVFYQEDSAPQDSTTYRPAVQTYPWALKKIDLAKGQKVVVADAAALGLGGAVEQKEQKASKIMRLQIKTPSFAQAGGMASLGTSASWGDAAPKSIAAGSFLAGVSHEPLKDAVGSPAHMGVVKTPFAAARCTPGVDCPSTPRKKKSPRCTPGVDCPGSSKPRCTPGIDCPGNGGSTPLPPNYRRRPRRQPSSRPPSSSPYVERGVDTAGYWRLYTDILGRYHESHGSWSTETGHGVLRRGGTETATSQGTSYSISLKASSKRNTYRLYYRWTGRNCDPYDTSNCVSWSSQYSWFYYGVEHGASSSMDVSVEFIDDKELLPWESEKLDIYYNGSRVWIKETDTAYDYDQQGPMIDQRAGTALIELTPGAKILRAPESKKVKAYLVASGGSLSLVIEDERTDFYDGEDLEVAVAVKYRKSFFSRPVIYNRRRNGPLKITVKAGQGKTTVSLPATRSGKYYITEWSFRRAGSAISSNRWVYKGAGNTVRK